MVERIVVEHGPSTPYRASPSRAIAMPRRPSKPQTGALQDTDRMVKRGSSRTLGGSEIGTRDVRQTERDGEPSKLRRSTRRRTRVEPYPTPDSASSTSGSQSSMETNSSKRKGKRKYDSPTLQVRDVSKRQTKNSQHDPAPTKQVSDSSPSQARSGELEIPVNLSEHDMQRLCKYVATTIENQYKPLQQSLMSIATILKALKEDSSSMQTECKANRHAVGAIRGQVESNRVAISNELRDVKGLMQRELEEIHLSISELREDDDEEYW